jgi:hypothetical protein
MDIIEKHERVVFVIWEPLRSVLFQKYKRIGGHCSAMVGCLELKTIKNCLPLGEIVRSFLRFEDPAKIPLLPGNTGRTL